ncbi:LysR family transcriptional regulator [Marinomonas posidonica]|uniref:Transcriptional regulator, LysR family n=1 Tax=Marinomonas posidonica (strain CECT 7376 / NCIMB 14433 / IVIA-Po-181) TaxID=491952 RepID=F6CWZ6_MARPP|nr:LysR family transcriptional regulator [Marinomonas posidonica]AEF55558.1 transcriptional regulator, LysR family [Marinomonas posidonica IVIA-Po-181]
MANKFTLKQLTYFVLAGEHSSVTKAAELLFVSQPSISSAIHHLEDVTGLQLFIRHHAQGLSLTTQGWQFFHKAKALLKGADDLSQFAQTLGTEVSGSLSIVGFPTFTSLMMPSMLKEFVDQYPAVNVQCDEMHQRDLIQGLINSKYELAITYDMQLPANIEFTPLISLPPYVVVALNHPLAKKKQVSIHELAKHPMVMLDWPMSREYFSSLFIGQGIEPMISHNAHSLGMVRGMVANGFGYSIFNTPVHSNVALDGTKFASIPLKEELMPLTMGVAKLEQSQLTPAAEAFVEVLKNFASGILTPSQESSAERKTAV